MAATEHLYSDDESDDENDEESDDENDEESDDENDEESDDGWALSALRDTVGATRTPDTVHNGLR